MATNRCNTSNAGFSIENPAYDKVVIVRERVVQPRQRQEAPRQAAPVTQRKHTTPIPASSRTPVNAASSSTPQYDQGEYEYESNTSEIVLE